MRIHNIKIIRGFGPDTVCLYTDLREATWPFTGNLIMKFAAAQGTAEQYCKEHFAGIPVEVIQGASPAPQIPANGNAKRGRKGARYA